MSSENPQPAQGKAGWRGAAHGASPLSPGPKGGWTQRKDYRPQQAVLWRRVKIAVWTLLSAALIVGFIVKLLFTPTRTPLVAVVLTGYDAPLPPNAWAREDFQRFVQLDREEVLKCAEIAWESREQGLRELCRQIDAAKPGGPGKNTLILYLSLHGAVDAEGQPCLLPPGASPTDSSQWLAVRELLQRLFLDQRPGKISDRIHKLLVFDAQRIESNWPLGVLYNGFADRLPGVVEDAHVPNLAVLTAAGPGQVGYAAPELRGSLFGHFFARGLRGAADEESSGNGDHRVGLQELYRYLTAHVGQWAVENRADVQQPMLIPEAADFPLAFVMSKRQAAAEPDQTQRDPRWSEVGAIWKKDELLRQRNVERFEPVAYAEFQRKLLRLEELVLAGSAYDDQYVEGRKELEELAAALARDPPPRNYAAYSLPLALASFGARSIEDGRKDLPAPWRKPAAASPPAASPAAKKAAPEPAHPYQYLPAALEGWSHFQGNPALEKLPELLGFIDGAQRQQPADVVEVHFLRMLNAYLDRPPGAERVALAAAACGAAQRVAAPADERIHYWIEPLIDAADRDRRRAEDLLFVGSGDALSEADRLFADVAGKTGKGGTYQAAAGLAERIAGAFGLRDRAYAETPQLAQWLLARLHDAPPSQLDDLQQLLRGSWAFGNELDRSLQRGQWSSDLTDLQQTVDEKLRGLEKAFADQCYQLRVVAGTDRQTLRAIAGVMAVPLVTGDARNQLREKYLLILNAHAGDAADGQVALQAAGAAADRADSGAATDRWLARLTRAGQHPALAILDQAQNESDAAQSPVPIPPADGSAQPPREPGKRDRAGQFMALAQQGEKVRRLLGAIPTAVKTRIDATAHLLSAESSSESVLPVAVRQGESQADRLLRACASFLGRRYGADPASAPASQLRRLDLHYLLLWQCRRTVDDFWGPPPGHDVSFFQTVTQQYLAAAKDLCPNDARGNRAAEVLLAARDKAAQEGIRAKPSELTLDEDEPAVKQNLVLQLSKDLPEGEAAVYLRSANGPTIPLLTAEKQPLRRLDLPVDGAAKSERREYLVPNNEQLAGVTVLQATALFRGHVYARDFPVERSAAGLEVVHFRPQYSRPRLSVYGQAGQHAAVMFIQDCSGSMSTRMTGESNTGNRRIDIARSTLQAVLARLIDPDRPYHVGLIAYGHRARWSGQEGEKTGSVITRPPGLEIHPSEDVEVMGPLLPLRPFDKNQMQRIVERLQSLEPWGQTPLYMGILDAIDAFPRDAPAGPRRIVAMTDGFDEPGYAGALPGVPAPRRGVKFRKDVEDVLRQPGNEGIQLDILGFNIEVANAADQQSLKDLTELAEHTGGGFFPVNDPTSLLKALEKSLQLGSYVVQRTSDGGEVTPAPLELNRTFIFPPVERKTAYIVKLKDQAEPAQAEVAIEGGEALELFVRDDPRRHARRLVGRRYDRDLRVSSDGVINPADPQNHYFLGAHLPEWQGRAVRFPVSIQNADEEQFSPRPAEAWVQIRPLGSKAGQAGAYVFYDPQYENERPVPVLSCLALGWPEDARAAEVLLWCKMTKTAPDRTIPIGRFGQQKLATGAGQEAAFELEVKRGANADAALTVTIIERHGAGSGLDTVKVEIDPSPRKVVHRYNAPAGTIRHSFYYDDAAAGQIDDYRVLLTTRKRLAEQAIALPEPLVITIPRVAVAAER